MPLAPPCPPCHDNGRVQALQPLGEDHYAAAWDNESAYHGEVVVYAGEEDDTKHDAEAGAERVAATEEEPEGCRAEEQPESAGKRALDGAGEQRACGGGDWRGAWHREQGHGIGWWAQHGSRGTA